MAERVLVVEDDEITAEFILGGLAQHGLTADRAANGRDGLFMGTDGNYDAIILDRMLPALDGLSVLRALRAADIETPVILLSALASVDERVAGLEAGADDYLVKPFAFAELLARLKLQFRRRSAPAEAGDVRLSCGDLELNRLTRRVTRGGITIALQPREFRLLEYLMQNKDAVVTRTMLLESVWDYHFDPGTNVIDVHISRIRRKIDEGQAVPLLHTVRGAGYRLSDVP